MRLLEVLALMAEGRTIAGIARRLSLTERTVETHVTSIIQAGPRPARGRRPSSVLVVLGYLKSLGAA